MHAKTLKKTQILEAGLELFYKHGYNGTGVKDIVDAAGVPKGSFYNYFDSKEAFAVEVLDYLSEQHGEEMRIRLIEGDAPAVQKIAAFMEEQIEAALEEGEFSGCLVGNMCQEMATACEPIRQAVSNLMKKDIAVFAEVIAQGQRDGSINPNLEPQATAEFMFAAWEGALLKMKADRSRRAFDVFAKHAELLFSV